MKLTISKTIGDLFDYQAAGEHDFDVYVNYEGSDIIVLSSIDVVRHLEYFYNEWRMFTRSETLYGEYAYLLQCFDEYIDDMQNNLNRIYAALMHTYDPIGDYARHETISYKNEHKVEYGKTVTTTATDYESKTEYNSTVADDIKTYDNVSVADAKSTSKTGDDTTTLNGTMETATTGDDTTTDTRLANDNKRDVVGTKSSPQKLISDEIKLRIHNDFMDIVVNGFAEKYLFLSAGV